MEEPDIPTPHEALADALVGAGTVIGRLMGHMLHSQAVTGRMDPPVPEALYAVLYDTIEPMAESRAFELGVTARVLNDALALIVAEVQLLPIDADERPRARRRRGRGRRG